MKYNEEERKIHLAYHEAGHAVIRIKNLNTHKKGTKNNFSYSPRDVPGGYNLIMLQKRNFLLLIKMLDIKLHLIWADRVAEEIIFNEVSNGAYDDFRQVKKMNRLLIFIMV
ncbi:hypothetical protein ACEW7V_00470 [Areca yellow leaf disease phytoplasma]|uniref:hypothetical protein n=1 Tax=Areca yellow leaf disease phytoplasma TaxID=927614 RepID=UPI0035B536E7